MNGGSPKDPGLWPREHGAYMELAFPILSAWVLGSPGVASFALGVAAILTFLAHEPMMVLLGKRGPRRKREQWGAAQRRLVVLGGLAAGAGGAGLLTATPTVRLLALAPLAVGVLSVGLAFTGRERSLLGELHVALSLSTIALPVAAAAGVPTIRAAALVGVWALGFSMGTVAARGVLLQKRDRGRGLRVAAILALAVAVAGASLAASGLLPAAWGLAPLPFALVALGLALRPPSPRRMMAIGFGLLGASATTLLTLAMGLPSP